jgi:hypothetical protein
MLNFHLHEKVGAQHDLERVVPAKDDWAVERWPGVDFLNRFGQNLQIWQIFCL